MVEAQALDEELKSNADHDARRQGKETAVGDGTGSQTCCRCQPKPEGSKGAAEGLRQAAEEGGPEHGAPSGAEGHVEGQSHGEALGDVVDKESHENVEAEPRIYVIGSEGDETLRKLVKGNGDARLQADGEEGVFGNVVVMLCFVVALVHDNAVAVVMVGKTAVGKAASVMTMVNGSV